MLVTLTSLNINVICDWTLVHQAISHGIGSKYRLTLSRYTVVHIIIRLRNERFETRHRTKR